MHVHHALCCLLILAVLLSCTVIKYIFTSFKNWVILNAHNKATNSKSGQELVFD